MKVLIAGGSGFIGTYLKKELQSKGYHVSTLSRSPEKGNLTWDDLETHETDIIINLTGRGIFDKKWTQEFKEELVSSRVLTTNRLVEYTKKHPVKLFLSASAIGIYANKDETYDESGMLNYSFIGHLCQDWENSAKKNKADRTVILRIGQVLGSGGVLKKLLPLFKKGLGAVIGDGTQPFPFISVKDLSSLILFCIENNQASGVINAVSDQKITQKEFALALSRTLKKPLFLKLPKWLIHLLFKEKSELLLRRSSIEPKALKELGFEFSNPAIDSAIKQALS